MKKLVKVTLPVPGTHLARALQDQHMTRYRLSKLTGLSQTTIARIISGKCKITVETALLLGAAFGVEWQFWANLQLQYDGILALRRMSDRVERVSAESAAARVTA